MTLIILLESLSNQRNQRNIMNNLDNQAANEGSAITRMNGYRLQRSNVKRQETHVHKPYHPRPMPDFLKGFLLEKINGRTSHSTDFENQIRG